MLALSLFLTIQISAQVSISPDNSPADNSAILDVKSINKGVVLPRMSFAQRNAISDPVEGLMVYCTNCGSNNTGSLSVFMNGQWYILQTALSSSSCGSSLTINHVAGNVAPVTKTVTYGIVTNIPGEPSKCWITRNLGASQQASAVNDATEASAGWYWQFNRKQGYKNDGTTRTPNTTWITSINENLDWQTANDPCAIELGSGWRLPTKTEWENVDASGIWTTWNGPWSSDLKLHAAGYLYTTNGSIYSRGLYGHYWCSAQFSNGFGWQIWFGSADSDLGNLDKSCGFPMRCVRN